MTQEDRPSPPACGMWRTSARTAYKEIGLKPASEEILCGYVSDGNGAERHGGLEGEA